VGSVGRKHASTDAFPPNKQMTSSSQETAVDALTAVYTAIKNLQLYDSDSHQSVESTIEKAYKAISQIVKTGGTLTVGRMENELIIDGEALKESFQKTPGLDGFRAFLSRVGIMRVAFDKGFSRREFQLFLKRAARQPEVLIHDGKELAGVTLEPLPHIHASSKAYLPIEEAPADDVTTAPVRDQLFTQVLTDAEGICENSELVDRIPDLVMALLAQGDNEKVHQLLHHLSLTSDTSGQAVQTTIIEIFNHVGRLLLKEKCIEELGAITLPLLHWMKRETMVTPLYQEVCNLLKDAARELIQANWFDAACHILEAFNHIHYGAVRKDTTLRKFAGQILQAAGADPVMAHLVDEFITNSNNFQKAAAQTLILLGSVATLPLLDKLRESEDRMLRMQILQVISDMGPAAAGSVSDHLKQGGPWYYLRNLSHLMGRIGSKTHLDVLKPLMLHSDFRVQRETFNTIYKIGDSEREGILLEVLPRLEDRAKIPVVAMLGALRSQTAVGEFCRILRDRPLVASMTRLNLEEMICTNLGKIGSEEALPSLEALAAQKSLINTDQMRRVRNAAGDAIEMIEQMHADDVIEMTEPLPESEQPLWSGDTDGALTAGGETGQLSKKDLVARYLAQGNRKAAIKLLFDWTIRLARAKKFDKAEALREKMIKIDPVALNEIIKSGEIIETEKSEAIDADHLDTWSELYDLLTTEEANIFYYGLQEKICKSNQVIIEQGQVNNRFFLVDKGTLKLVYRQGQGAILIKTLGKGDVAGHDTFFENSVATYSMISQTGIHLSCLERDTWLKWKTSMPSLDEKIRRYCTEALDSSAIWKNRTIDRRRQRRIELAAKLAVKVISPDGPAEDTPLRGKLINISQGGAAFFMKLSKGETARLLLGQSLNISLLENDGNPMSPPIGQTGTVVAAQLHLLNDYMVHLSFDKKLSPHQMAVFEAKGAAEP
jgi:HEAT repeat protein/CRP-like cAMP-binding protein